MTTLELQAQNIVQQDDSDQDVEVTNEEKYNALLEQRKQRRAVSTDFIKLLPATFIAKLAISEF